MQYLTPLMSVVNCWLCQQQQLPVRVLKVIQPQSTDTISRYPVTADVSSRYRTSADAANSADLTVAKVRTSSKEVSRNSVFFEFLQYQVGTAVVFLPCDAYAIVRCLSICLSVRPSLTFMYCVKMSDIFSNFCTVWQPQHYASFSVRNVTAVFRRGLPWGVKCRWDMKNCDFQPSSRCISEIIQIDIKSPLTTISYSLVCHLGSAFKALL